jgi:hypothetical protein
MPVFLMCTLFGSGCRHLGPITEFGTAQGRTVLVVKGHPGALIGRPEPDWHPPEPRPVAHVKIYWLRIDREQGHQLYTTQSDTNGSYEVRLPVGRYLARSATQARRELDKVEKDGKADEATLIRVLFPGLDHDRNGRDALPDETGIEIKHGQTHHEDITAEVLFVD